MKPQLLGFHHIAIIASNYARSKHFYMEILGAKQLNETYRAERDSYKLDLSFPDGLSLIHISSRCCFFKFSFEVFYRTEITFDSCF